ncbi:MAG: MBL fold metallo-hydrolase [Promethearchaeota archaeon]|jgi:glyoxylase-like metal-dependent hydrolase (beta-lactamase superfamily II)
MSEENHHFEISKHKDHLYVIKENISIVHPVYTNDPLNLYLLLGSHSALLLDTGCGLYPLKPIVDELIGTRKLLVFNSHAHWDHILGNEEFKEIYIHENEADIVSNSYDLSFLIDSPREIVKRYEERNFSIPPAQTINTLKDGDIFDLGEIIVKIIHCPGHSPGSICLLTSTSELFTGDVAYYGDQFLPKKKNFRTVTETLSKLITICDVQGGFELYPSHRSYPCEKTLLTELYNGIINIKKIWKSRKAYDFFKAWEIYDGKFRYYIARR